MIAKPVVVGLGRLTHLALRSDTRAEGRTYCGRWWTADTDPDIDIDCYQCRAAYAAGRHPKEVNRVKLDGFRSFASDHPVQIVIKDDKDDTLLVIFGVTEISMETDQFGKQKSRPSLLANGCTIANFDTDLRDESYEGYWVIPAGFISDIWPRAGLSINNVDPGIDIENEIAFERWTIR